MNATERTHLVTDPAVADTDDLESSRRSLLGTAVLGAGVLGVALALGVAQQARATTAKLFGDDGAVTDPLVEA